LQKHKSLLLNIPVDFPTIQVAITMLNTSDVGAGGASINVPAAYTETPSAALVLSIFTNAPSAAFGSTVTAATPFNATCNGAASVNAPIGGHAPFVIDWTPSNPTGDGTLSITGLTTRTWTCTITDANSCNATVVFNITKPSIITGSQTLQVCTGQSVIVDPSTYNASETYSDTVLLIRNLR
jgi:hypothetical protein